MWTSRYLGAKRKGSRSRKYNLSEPGSYEKAAQHTFSWLWKVHCDLTGETCPMQLLDLQEE
eukprot:6368784-Amphidinium_carterae.1